MGPSARGTVALPPGLGPLGVSESFATSAPISLYGATKLASEALALEYGHAFDLPVFINRCGILAGAGQFGRPDQGIFSYWINSHLRRRPLKYIGFGGTGHQVRDCLHPKDLAPLLAAQLAAPKIAAADRIVNFGGGVASAMSLRQLTDWCDDRFGAHPVAADPAARRVRHSVDRPRSVEGRSGVGLEAEDAPPRHPGGDLRACRHPPRLAGAFGSALMSLNLFSVVVPARDESESLPSTLRDHPCRVPARGGAPRDRRGRRREPRRDVGGPRSPSGARYPRSSLCRIPGSTGLAARSCTASAR